MIRHVKKQKIMTLNQKKIGIEGEIKAVMELVNKYVNRTICLYVQYSRGKHNHNKKKMGDKVLKQPIANVQRSAWHTIDPQLICPIRISVESFKAVFHGNPWENFLSSMNIKKRLLLVHFYPTNTVDVVMGCVSFFAFAVRMLKISLLPSSQQVILVPFCTQCYSLDLIFLTFKFSV